MPSMKRKRIPSYKGTTTKSEILKAVKRAKYEPEYKSKFKLYRWNNKNIFPMKLRQTLVYSEVFSLTTGTTPGLVQTANFRANGMFDPRVAVGGHQPYGYDQLAAMYVKWCVLGCKITTHAVATNSTYNTGQTGINLSDPLGAALINAEGAIENQFSSYTALTQNSSPGKCSLGVDIAKYFGVKDLVDDNDFCGTEGADPVKQCRAVIWVASDQAAATTFTVTLKMEYDVIFLEPKNVSTS